MSLNYTGKPPDCVPSPEVLARLSVAVGEHGVRDVRADLAPYPRDYCGLLRVRSIEPLNFAITMAAGRILANVRHAAAAAAAAPSHWSLTGK